MRILTWNINGIRASKLRLKELFERLDADIICMQETKVTRDMLDERSAIVDGYNSYFSFSNARTGYSGVATFVRDSATPVKAEQGLSGVLASDDADNNIGSLGDLTEFPEDELQSLDKEGRTVITQHSVKDTDNTSYLLTVINVYCPRADPEREDRKAFKLQFYKLLQIRAEALLKAGSHVIVLGDINTSHRAIDHCDPDDHVEFIKNPGRKWLNQFLWDQHESAGAPSGGGQFVDTFRYFHPSTSNAFTCWNTMIGARATNYGTRIDYIFADKVLAKTGFTDCILMPDVEGSDHCPVKAELAWDVVPAQRCPALCTKYFPEFQGVQTKLVDFFKKSVKRPANGSDGSHDSSSQEGDKTCEVSCADHGTSKPTSTTSLPPAKKLKKEPLSKQSSLMNFFGKGTTGSLKTTVQQKSVPSSVESSVKSDLFTTNVSIESTVISGPDTTNVETQSRLAETSAWRNLLKGPPPAPLCKGHKEPCLLRVVKKDSLNKGRQFYVCPRPDGHKTNPEARCDHFEWVEKKKKPK